MEEYKAENKITGTTSQWIDPYGCAFLAYCLVLFIEKVAFDAHSLLGHDHHIHKQSDSAEPLLEQYPHLNDDAKSQADCTSCIKKVLDSPSCGYKDEVALKNVISNVGKFSTYMEASNAKSENGEDRLECSLNPLRGDSNRKLSVHAHHDPNSTSFFTALILLIALGMHSLFEGLALGLQTKVNDLVLIGTGILAHKWAEGFSLVSV